MNNTEIEVAAKIAWYVADYEKAWRERDSDRMSECYRELDRIATTDSLKVIRAACVIAAALIREDGAADHLHSRDYRMQVIRDQLARDTAESDESA